MPSEWRGVGCFLDWAGIGNTTPKSPRFTRDFAWIVSAHVGFSVCAATHMSIANNRLWRGREETCFSGEAQQEMCNRVPRFSHNQGKTSAS